MLTDKDIQKIIEANKQVFATKDDLKNFATKKDVMEIKTDIIGIKEDIGGLKQDVAIIKEDINGLKQSVAIIKEDIKDMRDDISGLRESVQSLILSVDRFVKVAEDLSQESAMATLKMNRHEEWIHLIAEKVGVQLKY